MFTNDSFTFCLVNLLIDVLACTKFHLLLPRFDVSLFSLFLICSLGVTILLLVILDWFILLTSGS